MNNCCICNKEVFTNNKPFNICSDCQKEPPVVDNFDLLIPTMQFSDENSFYFMQIIKRRKDNPKLQKDFKVISSKCIYNYDALYNMRTEIINICRNNNARALLWVNRRNIQQLGIHLAILTLEYIQSKQYKALPHIFDSVCGKYMDSTLESKTWIIDVDTKDVNILNKIANIIINIKGKLIQLVPTLHGYHILSTPFNSQEFKIQCFKQELPTIDIHKDNPTVLYYCP